MLAFSFNNRGLKALRLSLSEPFPIYFANMIETLKVFIILCIKWDNVTKERAVNHRFWRRKRLNHNPNIKIEEGERHG
jgi:uncharacterized protein (DUF2384 family)